MRPIPLLITAAAICTLAPVTRAAHVAILQNFANPEISTLQTWLADLGHTSTVYDQGAYATTDFTSANLVIWDDLSFQANGLTDADVAAFQSAFDAGVPLYFIGDDLAYSTINLSESVQLTWLNLIKIRAGGNGSPGGTLNITAPAHPIIDGPFGTVSPGFTLGVDPDANFSLNAGETVVGLRGSNTVLTAFQNPTPRTVTQNFLPTSSDVTQCEKLFKNSVAWLVPAVTHLPGDTQPYDNVIDLADLNNVLNYFGSTIPSGFAWPKTSGTVDLNDLNAVLNNFGNHTSASNLSVIPEPTSLLLLTTSSCLLIPRPRRRTL